VLGHSVLLNDVYYASEIEEVIILIYLLYLFNVYFDTKVCDTKIYHSNVTPCETKLLQIIHLHVRDFL